MVNPLQPLQKRALELFAQSELKADFYWTGGTLKAFRYLEKAKPLLIAKKSQEKQKIIKDTQEYFSSRSTAYLHRVLK